MAPSLTIVGDKCVHNTLGFDPGPYTEAEARTRAAEIVDEFDTHGGDDTAYPGSPTGPPNPCGPHRIVEVE